MTRRIDSGPQPSDEGPHPSAASPREAGDPPGELFRSCLPRIPGCGSIARRLLEANLSERVDGTLGDAKTIASELVNNAFLHGEGRIELWVSADPTHLRIDVSDQGHQGDVVTVRPERSGSRGLAIVDQLAHRWGVAGSTTHVWAELLISPAAAVVSA